MFLLAAVTPGNAAEAVAGAPPDSPINGCLFLLGTGPGTRPRTEAALSLLALLGCILWPRFQFQFRLPCVFWGWEAEAFGCS